MKLKKLFYLWIVVYLSGSTYSYADRIYIMNSPGYNTAEPELIKAIEDNGHTVVLDTSGYTGTPAMPPDFTSACIDPVNGYDWALLFWRHGLFGTSP